MYVLWGSDRHCKLPYFVINFMCQLDWAIGCPDFWLNIILGVSMIVFLDEINI